METRQYWNQLQDYDAEIISLARQPGTDALRARIRQLADGVRLAADIGCGPGNFLHDLAGAEDILAIDWSANMLRQAAGRAPSGTVFIEQDLRRLDLPRKPQLAICLNALFPESHGDALVLLRALFRNLEPRGVLLIVVPSLESQLYLANAQHFAAAMDGPDAEQASLRRRMADSLESFNNPLGYVRTGNGQVTKFWIAEEFERAVRLTEATVETDRFKVELDWPNDAFPPAVDRGPRPWHWGFVIRRVAASAEPGTG